MFDQSKRYDTAWEFFELRGDAVMILTPKAAIAVCNDAAVLNLVVVMIEGGIWTDPEFEAKLNCIWGGADPPMDHAAALDNNMKAASFIHAKGGLHDGFIVTLAPITGYEHKRQKSDGERH